MRGKAGPRPGGSVSADPPSRPVEEEVVLRFENVEKRFGGTQAVAGVDLEVRAGEIHALLGANGAGKSTLIKLLAGVHDPDRGMIRLRGRRIDDLHPRPPMSFIHQDLGLVEWMTVAENIALGEEYPRRLGLIDWNAVRAAARAALTTLGVEIEVDLAVSELPRTERSIVGLARALQRRHEVLVLDEPTASLPESETARLFEVLTRLRAAGVAILYVTHRLDEVFRLADRVSVMRDGRRVLTCRAEETTAEDLVLAIVGRRPAEVYIEAPDAASQPVLEVDELRSQGVGPVSFRVGSGEIVALVGLLGAGQNAVGRALCGVEPRDGGSVRIDGVPLPRSGVSDLVRRGVLFVTSNRETESLAPELTVAENIFLNPATRGRPFWRPCRRATEVVKAAEIVDRFGIRPDDPVAPVQTLSGGNQQKVVLARWLGLGARVLVLEEPTMGVAVGAKTDLYHMLQAELEHGAGIVLVSSDLEEVAAIASRALVFGRGLIVDELSRGELSVARLTGVVGGAPEEVAQ